MEVSHDILKGQSPIIPIISPGLVFVQKAFLLGLFLEGLVIGENIAFQSRLVLTITD